MFGCEICGISFTTKYSLIEHIGAIHEGKKAFLNVTSVTTDVLIKMP